MKPQASIGCASIIRIKVPSLSSKRPIEASSASVQWVVLLRSPTGDLVRLDCVEIRSNQYTVGQGSIFVSEIVCVHMQRRHTIAGMIFVRFCLGSGQFFFLLKFHFCVILGSTSNYTLPRSRQSSSFSLGRVVIVLKWVTTVLVLSYKKIRSALITHSREAFRGTRH